MGRYATEPENIAKSAKARGSNLRVHFKVTLNFHQVFEAYNYSSKVYGFCHYKICPMHRMQGIKSF
jgi:hypothetical protein